MVALVTLTILGVTSLTASQLDMQITQNMRHHKALQYGALTGQDHARDLAEDASFDGFDTYNTAFATAAHCTSQFIGAAVDSVDVSVPLTANAYQLADYEVDVCAAVCSDVTPPGWDLSQSETKRIAYTLDMVATGSMLDSTADAQSGTFLMFVETGHRRCE